MKRLLHLTWLCALIMVLQTGVSAQTVETWYKSPCNPLDVYSGVPGGSYPWVSEIDGQYIMYLDRNWHQQIHYMTSSDGVNWVDMGLLIAPGDFGWSGISHSQTMYDPNSGQYFMYYGGNNGSAWNNVGLATSPDGINWTDIGSVLTTGPSGSWDDYGVGLAKVLYDEELAEYYMLYQGAPGSGQRPHIGLARSVDGINWERVGSQPVLAAGTDFDANGCRYLGGFYKENQTYYCYYMGMDNGNIRRICRAYSTDLLSWVKEGPVLEASETWEGGGINYAMPFELNGVKSLYYQSNPGSGYHIGIAQIEEMGNDCVYYEPCELAADYTQPYLSDHCTVGLWHLDEDYGTTVEDASPNNLTGFLDGGPDWGAGQAGFDGAMHCGGTNYLHVPDNEVLTGMSQLTLECWFKLDSYGYDFWNYLFEKGGSYTVYVGDADEVNRDKLWAKITTNTGSYSILSDYKVSLDTWTHVAITYDGSAMKMFINGVLEVETAASGVISDSDTPLYVGSNNLGYQTGVPMHGWIDEARISNVAREYSGELLYSVDLDIKPGSCPNPLNATSRGSDWLWVGRESEEENAGADAIAFAKGNPNRQKRAVLPAALLGRADFDVTRIIPETIDLNGVPVMRWSYEDVATPLDADAGECDCNSSGSDGYIDLTLKILRSEIITSLGEVYDGQVIPLTVSGLLDDGTPFEGTDCILFINNVPMITDEAVDGPVVRVDNYPNPFNPTTTIRFTLDYASPTRLDIFNIAGQRVAALADGYLEAGEHSLIWNGRDENGARVASGMYFYRLKTDGYAITKKMVLLK